MEKILKYNMHQEDIISSPNNYCYKNFISYMPFLMEIIDCHVNIDVTFCVSIIKYLDKYLIRRSDSTQ